MIPLCRDQNIGVLPFSPLARGLLAGARQRAGGEQSARARTAAGRPFRDADYDVADAVRAVAGERQLPPAQVALAWVLGRPGVTAPIIGATKPRHMADAVQALDVELSDQEIAQVQGPYLPRAPDGGS